MNYEPRLRLIKKELKNLLSSYAIPIQFRNLEETQAKEIELTASAINKLFPNDSNQQMIEGAFSRAELKIKSTHMSRTWPKASHICAAIRQSMASEDDLPSVAPGWKPDTKKIHAARIKNGENVSEFYVHGKMAEELLREGLVTESDLQSYRDYLAVEKIDNK